MTILVDIEKQLFGLQTKSSLYVLGVDQLGLVRHVYWGERLESLEYFEMNPIHGITSNERPIDMTPEEYPVFGGLRYKEHCLKVNFSDMTRELVYRYAGFTANDETLVIHLEDVYYDFKIDLHYVVHEEYDLLERFVRIKNDSTDVVEVEKIHSAQFHVPSENLNFSNYHGHWGCEARLYREKVEFSKIVFENRRGISTHHHNPFFVLDKQATETSGEVYFGALKLTGNFSGVVEPTPYGETLVQLGINSHDFCLSLEAGEEFVAPAIIYGYTTGGFEKMSHILHRFARSKMLREELRPVLYNSWEATGFNVRCDEQIKLAHRAALMGAELFVIDDGWFGQRHGEEAGLGDWYVNPEKFPEGLAPLIKAVKAEGMKFGIWIEPEMVSPNSWLYQQHPDWIYHYETRDNDLARHQYVLNVAKPEVKQFIYEMIDELLTTYEIDYIKWDANRPITQAGAKKDVWYRHIENVYDIVRRIKDRHPTVLIEACASGGGRIDYGALSVFDDVWTSDNTDAYDRLSIQKGFSYIYPTKAMRAWVTDSPNFISRREIPLLFRFHVAMMGSLGIGANVLEFNEDEMELSKELIAEYKEIRPLIQDGDFYRLENSSNQDYQFYQYVKDDEAVLFAFLPKTQLPHRGARIKLRGLDRFSAYEVQFSNHQVKKSGDYLMKVGLDVFLLGDYESEIIKINKI